MASAVKAAAYCAALGQQSMTPSEARAIFCFDGKIDYTFNLDRLRSIPEHGLFVIRSPGGSAPVASLIADILLERDVDVVVRDYCLSACANRIFVASRRTYVVGSAIVAWHGGFRGAYCDQHLLASEPDSNESRARIAELRVYCDNKRAIDSFYQRRNISDGFTQAPQTRYANKLYRLMLGDEFDKRRAFWMWHPGNFKGYFRSEIAFQSYPGENNIAKLLRRHGLSTMRLVYDPPDAR